MPSPFGPCCCNEPCISELSFTCFQSKGFVETPVDPCDTPTCLSCEAPDITGVFTWTFFWEDLPELADATYKLWKKAGPPCADCETVPVDLSGYTLHGTYSTAYPSSGAGLAVSRGTFDSCDQANFQCWALEVIQTDGTHNVCCLATDADEGGCHDCVDISATGSVSQCQDPGIATLTVSFTLSILLRDGTPICPDLEGVDVEDATWTLDAGGIFSSGNGSVAAVTGQEISCSCDPTFPCELGTSASVTFTIAGRTCGATLDIHS